MYDTHAHLNSQEYQNQVEKIIRQSKEAGLTGIIVASSNVEDSLQAIDLAKKHPRYLYATVGIHPQNTNPKPSQTWLTQISQLDNLINESKEYIVAVGETGLDDSEPFSPGETLPSLEEQKELFQGQLELAAKYNLPVVIHARGLVDETIEIIRSRVTELRVAGGGLKEKDSERVTRNPKHENILNGVFHCYAGGKKRIAKILDLPGKWYFGIDGNVTYDQGLQNVVAEIPHDRLLLETDSPWLTPEPHRGKINSPAYLPLVADQVAKIWSTTLAEVAEITSQNTQTLFNL